MSRISNLQIIPLEKKYVDEIADIEYQVMKNPWSYESFIKSYNNYTCGKVILDKHKVIAFLWAQIIDNEAEIFKIAVIEEFQNFGVGKNMLNEFLCDCKKEGIKTIFLEVSSKNSSAVKLYKKQGFREYGRRNNYYGFDDHAILLSFKF